MKIRFCPLPFDKENKHFYTRRGKKTNDVLLNQLIIIVEWSGNAENFKVANKWAAVYIEPYLTQCTSFVLGLLIFK